MTLKIEATIPQDEISSGGGGAYLQKALAALGYAPAFIVSQAGVAALTQKLPVDDEHYGKGANLPAAADAVEKPKSTRSSKKAEPPKPAISTGEDRVGPEDTPETQTQDAADEAAEHAGKTTLTLDDVRKAVGRYTKTHGMAAAAKNVPTILGCAIADLPDDQAALAEAVGKIDAAVNAEAPPAEDAFDEAPAEQKEFTKDDVKAAMLAYGAKFDKTTDPAAMAFTKIDIVKIFTTLFGADVKTFSQIPATSEACGRAVDAINRAIAEDPFQRG